MGHLFELILNMDLKLDDFLLVEVTFDLLSNFGCLSVHASFQQTLGVVELVLLHIWEELCKLVIVFSGSSIILHVEVAVCE